MTSLAASLKVPVLGARSGSLRAAASRMRERLFEPVDPASLVVFRVVIGLTLCFATLRFWAKGWIFEHYLKPGFHFKYYGFEWVKPWPGAGMYVHFALMALAALGVAAGLFYRVSAALFCALFTYAHFIDKTHYLNHYYFVSLLTLLLAFLPLHHAGSLDLRLGLVPGAAFVPRWALWILRFQIGAVYFFAGVAKLTPDWLLHAQPLTIWLFANTDFPLLGPLFAYKATAYAMSWLGAAFDLSAPLLLSHRRTRPFAFCALIGFHALTGMLFPIGMFPWIMTLSALVFFPEDWPRRLSPGRLAGPPLPKREPESPRAPGEAGRRAVVAALLAYMLFQVFVPLRHFFYPGQVGWTEQGFRFSWRVMLVEKNGDVEITATDPKSGKRWTVDPRDYLDGYQVKQMSTQPDMIAELCRFIAGEFRDKGYSDIEVRARAHVAYNGRPPAPLLDPTVDLGREPDGLSPYRFLLSAPESKPGM
jgi:vitamin K-dependent gamma-carboxylase